VFIRTSKSRSSEELRGTAGQITVFFLRRLIRRGGAPSGAAASIAIGGYGGFNPHHHIGKYSIFIGNHRECSVALGETNLIRRELGEMPEAFLQDRFRRTLMSSSLPHGSDEPFGGARGGNILSEKMFFTEQK
jgi:hypothetical protein